MVRVLREHCVAVSVAHTGEAWFVQHLQNAQHYYIRSVRQSEAQAEIMKMAFQIREKTDTDSKESGKNC